MVVAARLGGGSEMDGETGGQEEVEVGRKRLYTEQGRTRENEVRTRSDRTTGGVELFGANGQIHTQSIHNPATIHTQFRLIPQHAIWLGEGCPFLPFSASAFPPFHGSGTWWLDHHQYRSSRLSALECRNDEMPRD